MTEPASGLFLGGLGVLIAEWLGTMLMWRPAFRMGIPVLRVTLPAPAALVAASEFSTSGAAVRNTGRDAWIFRHRYGLSDWQTPLFIRGSVVLRKNGLEVIARLPIGAFVSLAGWCIGAGMGAVLLAPILGGVLWLSW